MDKCTAPVFSPSNFLVCLILTLAILVVLPILYLLYAIFKSASVMCLINKLMFRLRYCGNGNTDPTIDLNFNLDNWLAANASIRDAIQWEGTDRYMHAYSTWTAEQKAQLAAACDSVRRGESAGLPVAPPLDIYPPTGSGSVWSTNFAPDLAWQYYLAYIAQSIMGESRGWFNWSLNSYSADELAMLFNSRYQFAYRFDMGKYIIAKQYMYQDPGIVDYGATTPGDPGRIFGFLFNNNIIGATRLDTIINLMDWCRPRLVHFEGGYDSANLEDIWQFGGFPPAERIIEGTVQTSQPGLGLQHWTAGCWGTTAFLRLLLRTANIPVQAMRLYCPNYVTHSTPHFASENLYLSHGDDLYGKTDYAIPPIPSGDILIDQATFDAWFGAAVSEQESCDNIGRTKVELALQYLPNGLLHMHCNDLQAGLDHANSSVYSFFHNVYTVAELEAAGLWTSMDAKIAGFGGCSSIPVPPGLYGW